MNGNASDRAKAVRRCNLCIESDGNRLQSKNHSDGLRQAGNPEINTPLSSFFVGLLDCLEKPTGSRANFLNKTPPDENVASFVGILCEKIKKRL